MGVSWTPPHICWPLGRSTQSPEPAALRKHLRASGEPPAGRLASRGQRPPRAASQWQADAGTVHLLLLCALPGKRFRQMGAGGGVLSPSLFPVWEERISLLPSCWSVLKEELFKDDFFLRTRLTETPHGSAASSQPCEGLLLRCAHAQLPSLLLVSELLGWLPDPSRSHLQNLCVATEWGPPTPGVPPLVSGPASPASHPPPLAAVLSRLGFALAVVLLETIHTRSTQMSTYQLSLQPSLDTAQHLSLFS